MPKENQGIFKESAFTIKRFAQYIASSRK